MFNVPEFSVSEFSASIKRVVEDAFGYVKIRGEITGFKRASSGHLYFSLKDEDAILSAVCFKNMADAVDFEVADGLQIVASGQITTYGGRSNYQIIVEKIEIAGIGAILEMIEKRRQKLAAEGLFDAVHKKEIPFFPRKIGVITSQTGAVIQDILHRVEARCPCHVLVYPVAVQGKDSAKQIIKAINYFDKLKGENRVDVLIIARGGGSFEDLLPFYDEDLVRAVFACQTPVISAVGHETDTTMLDFVADLRAPTPTAAAEMATPVLEELQEGIKYFSQRISDAKTRILNQKLQEIEFLTKYLVDPAKIIAKFVEKFNNIEEKMQFFVKNQLAKKEKELSSTSLTPKIIFDKIEAQNQRILYAQSLMESRFGEFFRNLENKLENLAKLLKAQHYQEILNRGFCLIKDKNNKLISSIEDVVLKEEIAVEMKDGAFSAYVLNIKKNVVEDKNEDEIQTKLI